MPKLSVVVTVDSDIAYQSIDGQNLLTTALIAANNFCQETSLPNKLYLAADNLDKAREATQNLTFEFGEISCRVGDPKELAKAVQDLDFEMIAIHDAQRPLTSSKQFHRTLEGLFGCDAVRPTMAFTETLKAVNEDSELTYTIDRTSMRRVSSPEIMRRSVIDFSGIHSNWSLPLISETRFSEVEADPESVRINSADEITLMEALLNWQQKIVN